MVLCFAGCSSLRQKWQLFVRHSFSFSASTIEYDQLLCWTLIFQATVIVVCLFGLTFFLHIYYSTWLFVPSEAHLPGKSDSWLHFWHRLFPLLLLLSMVIALTDAHLPGKSGNCLPVPYRLLPSFDHWAWLFTSLDSHLPDKGSSHTPVWHCSSLPFLSWNTVLYFVGRSSSRQKW